ncbi:MAG: bL21 family ribosomal protein [Candidatus Daviesbacteria bacterium]|nr:bL21 family ribosomal protein [Candidatus Daviesbacteria bacterium]
MLNFVVCEISGKQYKFVPGQPLDVYWEKGNKDINANVLLISENGKLKIGQPYLKDKINLKMLEEKKGKKITARIYHAKANYRRVTGIKQVMAKLILDVKKPLD